MRRLRQAKFSQIFEKLRKNSDNRSTCGFLIFLAHGTRHYIGGGVVVPPPIFFFALFFALFFGLPRMAIRTYIAFDFGLIVERQFEQVPFLCITQTIQKF